MTLPLETLVERKILGMSLQQLELRCTSNTVHYVLNQEHAKDALLTSNELTRVLSKTPKFRPTPRIIKPTTVAGDCDILGHRLIKTFNRFVCKDFIERAKVNSKLAGIVPWKPKTVSALKGLLCNAQSRLLRHLKTVGVRLEDKQCSMSWAGAIH